MIITDKTKLAYTFYGHPRTFRENQSLIPHLLDPWPGDIFIHIFPQRDLSPHQEAWHADRAGQGEPVTDKDLQWIRSVYHSTRHPIIAFGVDQKPDSTHYIPPFAARFGGRHSGQEVQKLRRAAEVAMNDRYDLVFRLRFDLVFLEPFAMPAEIDEDTLYGAYNLTAIEGGVDDDLFNYGSARAIDACFGEAVPAAEVDLIPGYGFQGEALVTSIRKRAGLKYANHAPMQCGLLRSTGLMKIRV